MTTIIERNKKIWNSKIFALVFVPVFIVLIEYTQQVKHHQRSGFSDDAVTVIFSCVFGFILLQTFIEFAFMPKGAILDTDTKTIEIQYFFKRRTIYLDEIASYGLNYLTVSGRYSSTTYDGVMINLNSGEQVIISNYYLAEYLDIYNYLKQVHIPDADTQKLNKWSYGWQCFKFRRQAIR